MTEFKFPVRVYIEDTDAGGIVFYLNYLKYMERARTELLRSLGFDRQYICNATSMFVVHSSNTKYLAPAQLDDELWVTARVLVVRCASILFEQVVMRDDSPLCWSEIKVAHVDKSDLKPVAMRDDMVSRLKQYYLPTSLHAD